MPKPHHVWIAITILCAGIVVLIITLTDSHHIEEAPKAACTNPGLLVPTTLTLNGYVTQSPIIALGKVLPTSDNSVQVKITKTLKGNALRSGQVIALCLPQVARQELKNDTTVLLFLKGKDTTFNTWVPTQTYGGIFTKNDNHQFRVGSSKDTYSLDEIQRTIDKHK